MTLSGVRFRTSLEKIIKWPISRNGGTDSAKIIQQASFRGFRNIYIFVYIQSHPQKNCSQPKLLNTLKAFFIYMKPTRTLKWSFVIAGTAIWLGLVGSVILVLVGG